MGILSPRLCSMPGQFRQKYLPGFSTKHPVILNHVARSSFRLRSVDAERRGTGPAASSLGVAPKSENKIGRFRRLEESWGHGTVETCRISGLLLTGNSLNQWNLRIVSSPGFRLNIPRST